MTDQISTTPNAHRILLYAEEAFIRSQADTDIVSYWENKMWEHLISWAALKYEQNIWAEQRKQLWIQSGILHRTKANLAQIAKWYPSAMIKIKMAEMDISLLIQQNQKAFQSKSKPKGS